MPAPKDSQTKKIKRLLEESAGFISAFGVIAGALVGAGHWIVKEINASVNSRIDTLSQELSDANLESQKATTRLELMVLIDHDPGNIIEIEKLAKTYFNAPMNGDSYMTSVFSRWCNAYHADCEVVLK